ncbi:hypothetical protein [Frigidibacter sp. ROC022]|uniref:hypothetical protein n=1 Tax=Frigidibacter sp. ROC022 TaxID=2971796 RepID=UPI00215A30AC|nr:hypothetical protein [Frigidibacter sp. ROC022]MCR8724924.1 hypothetical protein [Frigidibacter sp. ROC022]
MRKFLIALALPLLLAACGAEPVWAPDDVVQRAVVPNTGPTQISLMTVVSTRSGSGAHSGLIIDASQRVMYDPAGTFKHPAMPERNDLHYGLTDTRLAVYIDYHARVTYDVVIQTVQVSPQIAELVFERAKAEGAAPKAFCANSVSHILAGVPGFESIRSTMSPIKLMKEFRKLPGVTERIVHDDDADDNRYVLYVQPEEAS